MFPITNYTGFIGNVIENLNLACKYLNEPVIEIISENNENRRDYSEIINQINDFYYITEDDIVKFSDFSYSRKINDFKNMTYDEISKIPKNSIITLTGYNHIVNYFFDNIVPHLSHPVILVTLESDNIIINDKHINNSSITHWFTWNKQMEHKKLTALPIGLNYDRQFNSITNYLNSRDFNDNKKWLLFNCNLDTNSSRNDLLKLAKNKWADFVDIVPYQGFKNTFNRKSYTDGMIKIDTMKEESYKFIISLPDSGIDCYITQDALYIIPYQQCKDGRKSYTEGMINIDVTKEETYKLYDDYKFIISPPGTGIDCHRTWEALYIGVVPIVLKSSISDLYSDLPIVVINEWEDINFEFLKSKWNEIEELKRMNKYKMEKITLNYWKNKIKSYQTNNSDHQHDQHHNIHTGF